MEHERDHTPLERTERERLLGVYADLFVQRWDTYARQRPHARTYYRVKRPAGTPVPLTRSELIKHLNGELTIGLYSLDRTGRTSWSVIDSDEGLAPLTAVRSALTERGLPAYLEASRAGGHLWVFWQEALDPATAKKILSPYAVGLELFPAGDIPDENGLGLLMRAPLGVHQATGQRYPFLDETGRPVSPGVVRGQIAWLERHVRRADPMRLLAEAPLAAAKDRRAKAPAPPTRAAELPIAQFVREHDIRAVVGQYVRLNRAGVGRCPWPEHHRHGDRNPSFAIFEDTQKWWCFTERVGGNAFDFLCRYHGLTPAEMLRRWHEEA